MGRANADHFTRVCFSDRSSFAEIYTSRPRMFYKMRRLHELFPDEVTKVEEVKDDYSVVQHWRVPYHWFNCRKRPEPINKAPYQKRMPTKS